MAKQKTPIKKSATTQKRAPKLQTLLQKNEGYLPSFDKTKIWYKKSGPKTKETLVFCNGFMCDTGYWTPLVAELSKHYQTVIFDWRGHGNSLDPHHHPCSIEDLCLDILSVLDHLKISKAILLGHSMGVQTILNFCGEFPERVKALIPCFGTYARPLDTFYDSAFSKYFFELFTLFMQEFPDLARVTSPLFLKNPLWFEIGSVFGMLNPTLVDKTLVENYLHHFSTRDPLLVAELARSMQNHSAEHFLTKIKVPTLIFTGDKDTFTPLWLSKKMQKLIPQAKLKMIKNATHVGLIEQPELMSLHIDRFIRNHVN